MIVSVSMLLGVTLAGCGQAGPSTPHKARPSVSYEQIDPAKYGPMSVPSGLLGPEGANYPEVSEQEAINLFATVAAIAGVVSSQSDFPDGSIAVAKGFSPPDCCNVYRVQGLNFQTDIRTKDCLVILAIRLGSEDPAELGSLVPITEDEARAEAERLFRAISDAQQTGLERSGNLPPEQPETYRLASFSGSNLTGLDSWWVSWERVSPAGIPYHREAAAAQLRADGLLKNMGIRQTYECTDTEPVVTAEEAYALARPLLEKRIQELQQEFNEPPGFGPSLPDISIPENVELAYVPASFWDSDAAAVRSPESLANRLAWVLGAGMAGDVYVDALTGDVSTWGLSYYL